MKKTSSAIMNRLLPAVILIAAVIFVLNRFARREVFVGQQIAGTIPMDQIDHSAWNELLRTYVDDDGLVNYSGWKSSTSDRRKLQDYLSTLSAADPVATCPTDARLAFWINAYNAVTIEGILREYPTSSIRNHLPQVLGYNIWKDLKLYVDGQPFSLEQIEHQKLRTMHEPRIHFAIVCASMGCPRLLNSAYTADEIQNQLDENARDFFRRPSNFRYDQASKTFYLSSILKWFATDFGSHRRAQLKTISAWLPSEESRKAAVGGDVGVSFSDYDWNLNDSQNAGR
ncbi:MAG: DUF547 domain-containing protein [Planctomycetaceae bacterium]